LLPIFSFYLTG